MYKLMIIEDDFGIANAIKERALMWGFDVFVAEDFRDILTDYEKYQPHIILLDIKLPFFDGYYWCNEIRKLSNVPVIIISSASDNMNIVMAMNMGADDFIAKPFDLEVLMAKLQAVLRRTYDFSSDMQVIRHRGAFLNTGDNTLTYNDVQIPLTKNEYRIILCLMENKGKVVSRGRLMERLWKTESFIDDNTLTVNINRLRKKLDAAGLYNFISTKIGVGYIIEFE